MKIELNKATHPLVSFFFPSFSPLIFTMPILCIGSCSERQPVCKHCFQRNSGGSETNSRYSRAFGSLLTSLFERSLADSQSWLHFRTTWAAKPGFRGLWPVQACRVPCSEELAGSLVFCCYSLKVLGNFWARTPAFSFCIRPHKLCS